MSVAKQLCRWQNFGGKTLVANFGGKLWWQNFVGGKTTMIDVAVVGCAKKLSTRYCSFLL